MQSDLISWFFSLQPAPQCFKLWVWSHVWVWLRKNYLSSLAGIECLGWGRVVFGATQWEDTPALWESHPFVLHTGAPSSPAVVAAQPELACGMCGFCLAGKWKDEIYYVSRTGKKADFLQKLKKTPWILPAHPLQHSKQHQNLSGYKTSENQHPYAGISWAGFQDFSQFKKTLKPHHKTLFFLHLIGLVLFLHVKLLNLILFH